MDCFRRQEAGTSGFDRVLDLTGRPILSVSLRLMGWGEVRMEFWARRISWLVCGLLTVGFFPPQSLASGDGAPRTQASDIAQKHLLSFVGAPLPGHSTAQGPPSFYRADTLYEYMDGGADVYLLYNFQVLQHQNFKSGQAELSVDIFDMGSAEDAFGIYAAERSPSYHFLDVGTEAYRSEGILNFLQDRYYVKLAGAGPRVERSAAAVCAPALPEDCRDPVVPSPAEEDSARTSGEVFRTIYAQGPARPPLFEPGLHREL